MSYPSFSPTSSSTVAVAGVDEVVDGEADLVRQAEDGRQTALLMSPEQFEAVGAAVVEDEVGSGQHLQRDEGGAPSSVWAKRV